MAVLPVVIVSYNTAALLRRCLAALQQGTGPPLDILVVDNGSRDDTLAMLPAEFPAVSVLAQGRNLGFAAANNVALAALGFAGLNAPLERSTAGAGPAAAAPQTSPEYVLLLNPDTEVRPGAINRLLECIDRRPRAAMVGPQLVYPDGRFQHSAFHFPGLAQTLLDLFPMHHRLMNSRFNGRYPARQLPFAVDHPLGACMLVRGATLRAIGLLDEGYFMYVEEVDWCRRMRRAGWEVWCEPRAIVVHHEAQSTRQFRDTMYVQLWRSRDRYFHRYHGRAYVALIHLAMRWGLNRELGRLRRDLTLSADERARRSAAVVQVKEQFAQ